ncbi:secreted protein antigen [Mycobacterium bohemicum DSM 44277]|uniref:Pilin n=1 Tax=Mycobacterium bohemicum DSM 44277 TaxID=1236609 RepID=A0A0U0W5M9_MYCBE|nr:secreted protein antigen [Mycobacterium bohemicum DSM 44277]
MVALSAFGLAAPGAQAAPAPGSHWCPGDAWNPGWGNVYDWDWSQCHDWQGAAGQSGPAAWGPAAAAAVVGAGGAADVEPDRRRVGILEQRNLDARLTDRRLGGQRQQFGSSTVHSAVRASRRARW